MSMDAQKLSLPVAVVASLLAGALGIGGSWAASKGKIDDAAKTAEEAKQEASEARKETQAHAIQLEGQKKDLQYLKEGLDRIERALGTK